MLLGNVWSALSPWKAAADFVAWASRRLGTDREPPFEYPERLGRWPAAVLLFAFATLELAYVDPASPHALAAAIAVYSVLTWAGATAFGREAWFAYGDGFSVYYGLLARIAPLAKVSGRIVVRWPCSGLAVRERVPGTIAFVAVMLGSVLFDGFSRTSIWQDRYYDVQVELLDRPGLADLAGTLMSLAGLALAVGAVGLAFRLAVAGTSRIAGGGEDLPGAFAASLVPIALVYVVAHYFSLLVLQGQVGVRLLSDPFGWGWDVFGTKAFEPNFTVLTPNAIWYVAVASLVVGHVAGLVLAHDRAVGLYRSPRTAMWSQYPMLALMVAYTVGGLWVLSQG